jgi:hypothetical protein
MMASKQIRLERKKLLTVSLPLSLKLDKRIAFRFPSSMVAHDAHGLDVAEDLEFLLQTIFIGFKVEPTDKHSFVWICASCVFIVEWLP